MTWGCGMRKGTGRKGVELHEERLTRRKEIRKKKARNKGSGELKILSHARFKVLTVGYSEEG